MRSLNAGVLVRMELRSVVLIPNLSAIGNATAGRDGTGGMILCSEVSAESCLRRDFKRKLNSLRFVDASDKFPPSDSSPAAVCFFVFFSFLLWEER